MIDYEFTCVTHAITDLSYAIACCGRDSKNKRMFLQGYLEYLGEPATKKNIDSLLV